MRAKLYFLLLLGIGIFILNSCSEVASDEFCDDPGISCSDPNATIESCCTSTSCYLIYDGTKYPCNGTDCAEARDKVINACVVAMAGVEFKETDIVLMNSKLEELTRELLLEARAASGCSY